MLACQHGQLQVARILIAAGSDPTATNTVRIRKGTSMHKIVFSFLGRLHSSSPGSYEGTQQYS